jgi:MFS transporter, DHA2 family, multidrug resistance protein
MAAPSPIPLADSPQAGTHKWTIAAAVMLGAILQALDMSIVNVALPYMQRSFKVDVDQASWVVTSYLVAVSMMIPMTGWIAVRFGRKRYLVGSMVMFVIASALCGLAHGIGEMVIFRVIQGAAGAAMMPVSQAVLLETFPPEEHTLAMTTFGIGVMVAPVLGPTLGGWITMNWNWRWNFYINIPTGALGALMVYTFVHDPPYLRKQRSGSIDYPGIILIALALGLSQIILGRGGRAGWFAAPWVRYCSVVSALAMVLLVIRELKFPEPILDLRLLRSFDFTLSILLLSFQALALFSINLLNPLFMETVLGYDAWQAGLAVAPRGIGVVVALLAVGQLSRRGFDMRPFVSAGFILGAYEVWRMSHWTLGVGMGGVLIPIFLFGLALGAVFPIITAISVGGIPRERIGFAASLLGMMINTGAATGIAAATNLLTARWEVHQAQFAAVTPVHHLIGGTLGSPTWLMAYNDVYQVAAVILLLLAPWCLLLNRNAGGATEIVVE